MSKDRFTIRYEIEDGYAGPSRPQSFQVTSDIFDGDMTDEQIAELLYDMTDEDMRQKASVSLDNQDEFIAWAREKISETRAEEDKKGE